MAKKKNNSRRRRGIKIPIATVAGAVPGVARTITHWQAGWSSGTREMGRIYTGYDWWNNDWDIRRLMFGLGPLIGGTLVSKFVGGKLGINAALGRAGIPWIRL